MKTPFRIAVIGLGYVGLPLAMEFAEKYHVIGYDINMDRIHELSVGLDGTNEADLDNLSILLTHPKETSSLKFTSSLSDLSIATIYIVTVPTPIDQYKKPNLKPLLSASNAIGSVLKKGDLVIYESTVYPGCTEDECVPVLMKRSGLIYNVDFFCGYSPERINPGDKINTLTKIKKITSGSTPVTANFVNELYESIIEAGTHLAPSIKVAEAAKAIENAQRDLNISFVNELALIFDRLGIDTNDVIDAAGTKWNFLKFKPGLVGGHCIGVDPYYLAHKAESVGYHPEVILSGRRVNDNMGMFIANKVIKLMIHKEINVKKSKVLILGVTFKENCPDIRNSRVIDIYSELKEYGVLVDVFDPWANAEEVKRAYGFDLVTAVKPQYDAIILAVSHSEFLTLNYSSLKGHSGIIYDTKAFLDRQVVDGRL